MDGTEFSTDLTTGADANEAAADRVTALIRQHILAGNLRPDAKLRDQKIAEQFAVSRNTARDALRLLVAEGLVVSRLQRGYSVRRLVPSDVRDIYTVRRVVETSAIMRSSAASDELLHALNAVVTKAERSMGSGRWSDVATASLEFHQAVVGLVASRNLNAFFATQLAQLRLAFLAMTDDESGFQSNWIPRDRGIADLIISGRREQAATLMDAYLRDAEAEVVDALRLHGSPV